VLDAPTEPGNFHPLFRYSTTIYYFRTFLFGGLTRIGRDGQPAAHIAESWTATTDGMKWTFKLRPDVKFQDGTPLTAADVKFTYDLLAHPEYAGDLFDNVQFIKGARESRDGKASGVSGVRVVDAQTVEFELAEPYAPFLARTISGIDIVPQAALKDVAPKELLNHAFARTPIGAGAYRLVEWKPKESITLKAFPGYFEGSPEIETVVVRWVPSPATELADIKSGACSFIGLFATTPPDEFDNLKNDFQTFQFPAFTVHEIQLDLTKAMFQDKRVRQAMEYAMDREAIAKKLWNGKARVGNGPVHPLNWAYAEPKTTYGYDPNKAKQLLTEAGWTPGPGGVVQKDGQPLSFTIYAQKGHPEKSTIAAQDFFKAVGIDAKVESTEVNRILSEIRFAGKFEGVAGHFAASVFSDPADMVSRYWSKAVPQQNFMSFSSPRFDQVYLASLQTTDLDKRKQLMAELQEVIADELPVLPIVWLDDLFVLSKKVTIPEGINGGYQFMASLPRWKLKA